MNCFKWHKIRTKNVIRQMWIWMWLFAVKTLPVSSFFSFVEKEKEKWEEKKNNNNNCHSWCPTRKCPVFYLCMYIYNNIMATTSSSCFWFHIFLHLLLLCKQQKNDHIFVHKQTKRSQNSSKWCNSKLIST